MRTPCRVLGLGLLGLWLAGSAVFLVDAAQAPAASAPAQPGWHPHEGGLLRYRVNIRFGEEPDTMPAGWKFGRVSAVATSPDGQEVYVFQRGPKADPLVVFDAKGQYLRSWGRGEFGNPHGLRVDRDGAVWVTDNGDHQVIKYSPRGERLLTLGTKGRAGTDERTFNRPADIAFAPTGEVYVADGYGNSRVVKFAADGRYLTAWGTPGTGPVQFNTVHSVAVDATGTVYVSDRENNRIQIFDPSGKLLRIWTHLGATQNIFITPSWYAGTVPGDEMWIITHRNNIENLTYDTLAGRIMKVDRATGRILGSMESPGHWLHASPTGEIFIGSLTGNVFRFYPGWLERGLGAEEGLRPPN